MRPFSILCIIKYVINHIKKYVMKNVTENAANIIYNDGINLNEMVHNLKKMDNVYHPRYQVIDTMNKCKYVISKNGIILPVKPSGAAWDIQIIKKQDMVLK